MKKSSDGIVYILLWVSILIIVSLACNLPRNDRSNLTLDPPADDGSISGSYYSRGSGDHKVNFSVTTDGFATFHLEGAPDSETLTVDLGDEQTASMDWNGITLDGLGALTEEEQSALDVLMSSDMAHSLGMIPLDIGCQGGDEIDPKQVAALLVPLQMRFKYLVTERGAESQELIALSQCDYGGSDKGEGVSLIMLSRAAPVPVVFGYFPFDAEGAVESPKSSDMGLETACLAASPSLTADGPIPFNLLGSNPETITGVRINEWGPCEAMCRGACGADCEPRNCTQSKELRCEKDEDGQNTGMAVQYLVYDCGLHQGCIDHDNCYDKCNEEYGCYSWLAMDCRHGQSNTAAYKDVNYLCDRKAIEEYGYVTANDWRRGWGPKPMRETYEYLDTDYGKQQDLEKCPIEESAFPIPDEEDDSIPVGTYIGVTNIPSKLLETTSFTVEENEIILIVEEDGATHCEKILIYSYTGIGIDDALVYVTSEWTVIIEGKLTDAQGELKGTLTHHIVSTGPGTDDPQDSTSTSEIIYEIHVSGNIMSASPKVDVEIDKDIFSFELTKQ